jgi:hypothetical protein
MYLILNILWPIRLNRVLLLQILDGLLGFRTLICRLRFISEFGVSTTSASSFNRFVLTFECHTRAYLSNGLSVEFFAIAGLSVEFFAFEGSLNRLFSLAEGFLWFSL